MSWPSEPAGAPSDPRYWLDYEFHYTWADARATIFGLGTVRTTSMVLVILGVAGAFVEGLFIVVPAVLVLAILAIMWLWVVPRRLVRASAEQPVRWRIGPGGVVIDTALGSTTIEWGAVEFVRMRSKLVEMHRRSPAQISYSLPRRLLEPCDDAVIGEWLQRAHVRTRHWPSSGQRA